MMPVKRTVLHVFAMAIAAAGCATGTPQFDDSFDPAWMSVVMIERSALPALCGRDDQQDLMGCAKPFNDAPGASGAAGRGTCNIYVAAELIRDTATFNYVLRHEARHCRGWRHFRD